MELIDISVPAGWGDDALSKFIDLARTHQFEVCAKFPAEYAKLRSIDDLFVALTDNWTHPENPCSAPLALRTFSAFRATVQLVLAGQIPEAYMVMRGCLECALYSQHIDAVPASWEAWANREKDKDSLKACKKAFAGPNIFASLRSRDPALASDADMLYERAIELGAHPNNMAVVSSMDVQKTPEGAAWISHSFLSGDTPAFVLCLESTHQTGLVVLEILSLVFPKKAKAVALARRK